MLQVHILSDHLIEYFTMTGETMATTNEEHFERFFQRKKQVIFYSFLILSYLILSYLILSYLILSCLILSYQDSAEVWFEEDEDCDRTEQSSETVQGDHDDQLAEQRILLILCLNLLT